MQGDNDYIGTFVQIGIVSRCGLHFEIISAVFLSPTIHRSDDDQISGRLVTWTQHGSPAILQECPVAINQWEATELRIVGVGQR